MGTYRKEWDCCGSVTETEAWEPESCPFCTAAPNVAAQAGDEPMPWNRRYDLGASVEAAMLAEIRDWRAYAAQVSPRATADVERDPPVPATILRAALKNAVLGQSSYGTNYDGAKLGRAIEILVATTKPGA